MEGLPIMGLLQKNKQLELELEQRDRTICVLMSKITEFEREISMLRDRLDVIHKYTMNAK